MPRRKNPDPAKREEILHAAERVFSERGFKGATIRQVALEAGIASSLIFYYFKNKSALYEAVFQHFFDQIEALLRENLALDLDPLARLRRFLFTLTDYATTHRNMMKLLLREMIDDGRMARKIAGEYFKPLFEISQAFLEEGAREALFREVDPVHYIHSFIGMNLFYFVAEPVVRAAGATGDPYGPEEVEKRKTEMWNLVRSSLM